MLSTIEKFVQKNKLLSANDTVILGLSGGPDSVFLLQLFAQYKHAGIIKNLIAAHLDHEWRANSGSDVVFCEQLAQKYTIPFVHAKASELDIKLKQTGSKEDSGRQLRRFFLEKVRKEYNADKIALAHHAQDQQETFFIRLIRGTTLSGLAGMKAHDGVYIRPLLEINKTEIVDFLTQHSIPYLVDPTNEQESFLRNRIRKHVLPALEQCDQRFNVNFLRTINSLQKTEQLLHALTEQTFEQISTLKDGKRFIDSTKLQELHSVLADRILMFWLISEKVPFVPTEQFLEEIKRFLYESKSSSHQLHEQWSIQKQHGLTLIRKDSI